MSTPSTPSTTDPHHTSHPAHKLLTLAHPHSPETVSKIFTDKILHKPLLLTTTTTTDTTTSGTIDARSARRHIRLRKKAYALKHARPKPLSAREKRDLGLFDLRPEECRYDVYRELNTMWRRYILEVLGYIDREGRVVKGRVGSGVSSSSGAGLIASADFHGMEVEVVRCVDVGRVGLRGIVVRETRGAIVLVCDEREDLRGKGRKKGWRGKAKDDMNESLGEKSLEMDKVRMILKRGTVFRVVIDLPRADEDVNAQKDNDNQKDEDMDVGEISETSVAVRTQETKPNRRLIFELHGDQLEIRPVERAVKKFKWKAMDYL